MTKSKRKEMPTRFQYWPLLSVVIVLVFTFAITMLMTFRQGSSLETMQYEQLLYWYSPSMRQLFDLVVWIFFFGAHIIAIGTLWKMRVQWLRIVLGLFYLLYTANSILMGLFILMSTGAYELQHVDSLEFDGSSYHLAHWYFPPISTWGHVFVIYRCENDRNNCWTTSSYRNGMYVSGSEYLQYDEENNRLEAVRGAYTHTYYDLDGNRTEVERDEEVIFRLDADFIEDTSIQNLTTPITAENIGELELIRTIYHAIDDTGIHWSSHESLFQIGSDLATITFADDGINLGQFQIRPEGYLNFPNKLHTAELDLEQCGFAWHGVLSHETNLLVVNCMDVMNIYDASTYAYVGTLPFIEPHSIEIDMAFRPDDAVLAVSTWNGIEFYGIP